MWLWRLLSQKVLTILTFPFLERAWVLSWKAAPTGQAENSSFAASCNGMPLSSTCRSWLIHRRLMSYLLASVAAISVSHQMRIHKSSTVWRPSKPCASIPPANEKPSYRPFKRVRHLWKSCMQSCKPIMHHPASFPNFSFKKWRSSLALLQKRHLMTAKTRIQRRL